MKRLRRLRVRFALWIAGLVLLMLVVSGAVVYALLARRLVASLDESLQLVASQAIAAGHVDDPVNGPISFGDMLPEGSDADELRARGIDIRVLDPNGKVVETFGSTLDFPGGEVSFRSGLPQLAACATLADSPRTEDIRMCTAPVVQQDRVLGVVQVVQSLAGIRGILNHLLVALFATAPVLLGLAVGGGHALAARALAPIDAMTQTARRISAKDLTARLSVPDTDDEVGRLGATLDDMLSRLDNSFRRERQFTADASHELRTPLAAIETIVQVTRTRRRAPEDYERALDDIARRTSQLRALSEDLLDLARGDNQRPPLRFQVDVSLVLRDIAESMRSLAGAKGLDLNCCVPDGLIVAGDHDDLIRLFVNLVDNAVKYTQHGSITLEAVQDEARGQVRVTVTDTGVGIAAEHLLHIFDRFYRAEPSRSGEGAGLGLSIAQAIAQAQGGTIQADSAPGKGTVVTVGLPVPTHEPSPRAGNLPEWVTKLNG
jgi:signal transduction histidine kinase